MFLNSRRPMMINQSTDAPPLVFVNSYWTLAILGFIGIVGALFFLRELLFIAIIGDSKVWVIILVIVALYLFAVVYSILQMRARWTLFTDRLEYTNFLGAVTIIRREEILAFGPDWTSFRWELLDGRNRINIGMGIANFAMLKETLRGWALKL